MENPKVIEVIRGYELLGNGKDIPYYVMEAFYNFDGTFLAYRAADLEKEKRLLLQAKCNRERNTK